MWLQGSSPNAIIVIVTATRGFRIYSRTPRRAVVRLNTP
jgi:hypothetical protein